MGKHWRLLAAVWLLDNGTDCPSDVVCWGRRCVSHLHSSELSSHGLFLLSSCSRKAVWGWMCFPGCEELGLWKNQAAQKTPLVFSFPTHIFICIYLLLFYHLFKNSSWIYRKVVKVNGKIHHSVSSNVTSGSIIVHWSKLVINVTVNLQTSFGFHQFFHQSFFCYRTPSRIPHYIWSSHLISLFWSVTFSHCFF